MAGPWTAITFLSDMILVPNATNVLIMLRKIKFLFIFLADFNNTRL